MPGPSLLEHFAALEDPRQSWKVLFPLPEVLRLALCGTLAGTEDFVGIRRWGQVHQDFPRRLLPFKAGVPSHDALNDVINATDGEFFAQCFHEDLSRLRFGAGPQNMATVRHMAMNLLRGPKNKNRLKVRRKSAAWDTRYLEALLPQST